MSEAIKELVRNFFEAILEGDPAILDQFVSQDYQDHYPGFPDCLGPGSLIWGIPA